MDRIAITGIGCRLPGGCNSPDAYWQSLLAGRDLITETPPDRWNLKAFHCVDAAAPGRTYIRWGGFVDRPDEFDAAFFGIAPREAMRMDPQQRWLLETTWEALEDAGYPPSRLAGTNVGVYIGISGADYGDIQKRSRFDVDAYTNSGSALSIAANRISYLLDFRGPSFAIDTACSSSLVALDLACGALSRGEVSIAIVGGANSLFTPDATIGFSKASMLSPEGRCRAFDASANGYVRSEGAACVVLRPLDAALANGDRVYAVIRATFVNQDGRTGSMTVPSMRQQMALLDEVYRRAEVAPGQVSYVEAHGTGTPVGDPIEAAALGNVLGKASDRRSPLWIGSVKSNLGHLEPASGVAGLAKLALALHHRIIPTSLHFSKPNSQVSFDDLHLAVPTQPVPWIGAAGEPLCAGVNSFGFGGTNAHAVLVSAPATKVPLTTAPSGSPCVWTLSGRSKDALRDVAMRDAAFVADDAGSLRDLASVIQTRRDHHPHRLAVVARDKDHLRHTLENIANGVNSSDVIAGDARSDATDVAFVFSGQGAQWAGMGRDLADLSPVARETLERLAALMRPRWGRDLLQLMHDPGDSIFRTEIGQPLLFALEVALARVLQSWGMHPKWVLGHSAGEIAAAHICGALSEKDAVHLVLERAFAQERTCGAFAMVAAGLREDEAEALLAPYGGAIEVAAVNSATQMTLAGQIDAVRAVARTLESEGRFVRVLPLSYAFHTGAMDGIRDDLLEALGDLHPCAATVPYMSTVTGSEVQGESLGAEYWWRNLRRPVRFADAIRSVLSHGPTSFIEIGPHGALVRYIDEILREGNMAGAAVGTLKRDRPAQECLQEMLAQLHVRGIPVDWRRCNRGDAGHRPFPTYAWQRQRFWAESPDARALRLESPSHPLLGRLERGAARTWQSDIGMHTHPLLSDHVLDGKAVFPAAGYVELLLAAAGGDASKPVALRDVRFERVLRLEQTQLVQTSVDARTSAVRISAQPADQSGPWQSHAAAQIFEIGVPGPGRALAAIPDDAESLDIDALYARFAQAGHAYGSRFRTLRSAARWRDELWGRVALDPASTGDADAWRLHPALLDGALQLTLASVPYDPERDSLFLPVHIERIEWLRPAGRELICRLFNVHHQDVRSYADVELFTLQGELLATLRRCCCLKKQQPYRLALNPAAMYREQWKEAALAPGAIAGKWALCGLPPGHPLAAALEARGANVVRCDCDDLPDDATSALLWSAENETREISAQVTLDTVWPLVRLAQDVKRLAKLRQVVLVTSGATWSIPGDEGLRLRPMQSALAAMLRTVATELPQLGCRLVDLDPEDESTRVECVFAELAADVHDSESAYRSGRRYVQTFAKCAPGQLAARVVPARRDAPFVLDHPSPGQIDALQWVEAPDGLLRDDEVEIEVGATGLNFRDVLKALDVYPLDPAERRWFGDECAGVVRRVGPRVTSMSPGDPVVAIAAGCMGSRARAHECLVVRKPACLSFEQAATLPIAFLTADYALNQLARLQPGETVLIHAAAGGVGLAAIQIARRCGATVIATASAEKHEFLRSRGVQHVFNSRDLSFVHGVRSTTGGKGVDVVVNSLSGEFLTSSLELVKPLGRFVEIGKKDIFSNELLGLGVFRKAISFHAVDLARVVAEWPQSIGSRLRELLQLFDAGDLEPLSHVVYPASGIADGFRLMAQGRHRGKVVIGFDASSRPRIIKVRDASPIRADATYVITGGLTGFGWATAQWLVEEGARSLALISRRGDPTHDVAAIIATWCSRGIRVTVKPCDVADRKALQSEFDALSRAAPLIAGVFHSAMVLSDQLMGAATKDAFASVLAPKVQGSWNLHVCTRELDLDHFVLYSSCATLLGSAGQASYVAANRFMEALAMLRAEEGLPALAIGWGPLQDFGIVSKNAALARYLDQAGVRRIARDDVFAWLRFLLRRDVGCAYVANIDWSLFEKANRQATSDNRFSGVLTAVADDEQDDLRSRLLARPAVERSAFLLLHLRGVLASVLGGDASGIDQNAALPDLGVDSLMAFELKVRIDRELAVTLPPDRLGAGVTLVQLAELLLAMCGAGDVSQPAAKPRAERTWQVRQDGDDVLQIIPQARVGELERLSLDGAALVYLPDKLNTVGRFTDEQLHALFGTEPFVSNYFETELGLIGAVMLPVRSHLLFQPESRNLILRGLDLARCRGARCVSLTGLIPSATDYGKTLGLDDGRNSTALVTTGHATTTAAVVRTLRHMLLRSARDLGQQRVAVLGLGSIGQSCVRLMLSTLSHPAEITLCDLFARADTLADFGRELRTQHQFRGALRVAKSENEVPQDVYSSDVILAAVSAAEVLDVDRLQPGTLIVDDSYPPAFDLARAIERLQNRHDILFSNAGMLKLWTPIRETLVVPEGGNSAIQAFGAAAFRDEVARDPFELTACVLSSVLTGRDGSFPATLGVAGIEDLLAHYHGLERLGLRDAQFQCENYFVPDDCVQRFAERFGRTASRAAAD